MTYEGSIGEIDLIQRFVELGREHFTGAIRFEQDGIIKIIYFKGGDVLSASTNDRKDAIDEILLRAGKVGREHIKQALAKRQENETLGDALLNLGFITRKELTWARRVQVIGILRSVRSWTNGTYAIVADYLPKRDEGTIFPLSQIIVEFTVTEQDRASFDQAMEGGQAVFHKTPSFDSAFSSLDLNEDAAEIVKHIDGEKTAAEIAGVSGAEAFNVYKLLEAMRILGLIDKGTAAVDAPSIAIPPASDDFSLQVHDATGGMEAWTASEPSSSIPSPEPQVIPEPSHVSEDPKGEVPFALSMPGSKIASAPPVAGEKASWGFDEAQIEAARLSTAGAPKKRPPTANPRLMRPAKKSSILPMLVTALIVSTVIVGGWLWWKGRQTPAAVAVVSHPAKRPVIKQTTATDTTAVTASTPATTSTTSSSTITAAPINTADKPPKVAATTTAAATKSRLEKAPQGGRIITNVAPAAAAASDAGRAKYDAMARQYAQNPSGSYTVQFELVCQSSSLAKAIAAGGDSVWFVPVAYRGQSCYRVFWGHFDTREAAIGALGHIPRALHGSTPVVVSVPKS